MAKKPKDYCTWEDIYPKKALKGGKNGFSRATTEMQQSPAFHSLTANALRLLLWCDFKNYNASTNKRVMDATKRIFKLTYIEAEEHLGVTKPTFSRTKAELIEKGFLECTVKGGLRGVNGVASEYAMSNKWRKWEPPREQRNDMKKARAAKGKKQTPSKGALTGTSKGALTGCHLQMVKNHQTSKGALTAFDTEPVKAP